MAVEVTNGSVVKVGDVVEYHELDRQGWVICTVCRITAKGLTVRLPNGKTLNRPFRVTYRIRSWGGGTGNHYNFRRLDGRERWLLEMPKALEVVADCRRGLVSVVLTAENVRDHLTANHLAALADWLAREVPEGTP